MDLKELTKLLCSAGAPSGFEKPVCEIVRAELLPFADELRTDPLGNLIAIKRCGREGAKLILLNAHMDEVGFIVTAVEGGFLRFANLGGVDPRVLPTREVRVLGERPLFGVIDTLPPHLLKDGDADRAIDADKLCIDIGMDQEQALKAAPPGTPVVFSAGCVEYGNGRFCGKALDDRSGVAIVMKAFELLSARELKVDLCCFISAQEEVGHRGAVVGAWSLCPDAAIVVDVTHGRTPDARDVLNECGKGAVIEIGPNLSRAMGGELFRIAEEREVPHQTGVCPGGNSGTDAYAIQISRRGVPTALLSLPLRSMHTPVESVDVADMAAIQRLICEYILTVGEADCDA